MTSKTITINSNQLAVVDSFNLTRHITGLWLNERDRGTIACDFIEKQSYDKSQGLIGIYDAPKDFDGKKWLSEKIAEIKKGGNNIYLKGKILIKASEDTDDEQKGTFLTIELNCLEVADGYQQFYGDGSGIIYLPAYGNRRTDSHPLAFAIMLKYGKQLEGYNYPFDKLPVEYFGTLSENELVDLNIRENASKKKGMRAVADLDYLYAAEKLFSKGVKQIEFRRKWSDNIGQKLYYLCEIDRDTPVLKLLDRIYKEKIDISKFNFAELGKLRNKSTKEKRAYLFGGGESSKESKEAKSKKSMSGDKILELLKKSPCYLLNHIAQLVASNDTDGFVEISSNGKELNALYEKLFKDSTRFILKEEDEDDEDEKPETEKPKEPETEKPEEKPEKPKPEAKPKAKAKAPKE